MTEQEQAQALARWLDQPAGTPPPEGLDADVIESVYALHPDAAPALSLSADDILAGMDGFGVADEASQPAAEGMPPTPVRVATPWWRAANRVAGIGVLLATAATLMLVLLPVTFDQAESPVVGAVDMAENRSAATVPDPIVSVAEAEPEVEASAEVVASAGATAAAQTGPMDAYTAAGDAVADAGEIVQNEYRMEQQQRFGEGNLIPELQAAGDELDAVAVLDEIAPPSAVRTRRAEPSELGPGAVRQDIAFGLAEQAETKTERTDASARSGAVPTDLDDSWRSSVDAGTLGDIDRALAMAEAEARAGRPAQAAEAVIGYLGYPDLAGQYIAGRTAQWYLDAGDVGAANSAIQRGLALSSDNTSFRSLLLLLYGDVLQRQGNPQGADVQWSEAAALNRSR